MFSFGKIYNFVLKIFYCGILISILINQKHTVSMRIIYLVIFTLIIFNDYLRYYGKFSKRQYRIYSILFAMSSGAVLAVFERGYTPAYFFMLMYEIVVYCNDQWNKKLTAIHASIVTISWIAGVFMKGIEYFDITDLFGLLYYFMFILLFYSIRIQRKEKEKIERLNEELDEKNKQLERYASEIEDLIVAKERNRVAGELHDSLGHSLTAMIMHLDYIEKVVDTDIVKAKQLINKIQNHARECMESLRKTVYELKEKSDTFYLTKAIEALIDNVSIKGRVTIYTCYEGGIEDLEVKCKHVLYRVVKEAITNSIKHGNADKIYIQLSSLENCIVLEIEDNGIGCQDIIYGNGLKGIKDRIDSLGGKVQYVTDIDKGFRIYIEILLDEGETGD